ncbi:MAG: hypothetical protein U0670_10620 [Anaerolineae bacterium]
MNDRRCRCWDADAVEDAEWYVTPYPAAESTDPPAQVNQPPTVEQPSQTRQSSQAIPPRVQRETMSGAAPVHDTSAHTTPDAVPAPTGEFDHFFAEVDWSQVPDSWLPPSMQEAPGMIEAAPPEMPDAAPIDTPTDEEAPVIQRRVTPSIPTPTIQRRPAASSPSSRSEGTPSSKPAPQAAPQTTPPGSMPSAPPAVRSVSLDEAIMRAIGAESSPEPPTSPSSGGGEVSVDVEQLAREVYDRLRFRLRIERERRDNR